MATFLDDLNASENEIVVYDESKIVSTGMPLEHYIKEVVLDATGFTKTRVYLLKREWISPQSPSLKLFPVLAGSFIRLHPI